MKTLTERLREQRDMYLLCANYFSLRGNAYLAELCMKYARELGA